MLDGTRPTLGSRSSRRGRSSCSPGPGATEAAAGSRPGICTTGGAAVSVVLAGRPLGPGHAQQASIVTRMGIPVCDDPATADLVIDALIGYGLPGYPPRARRRLADWASTRSAPVVSLDGPSGQDLDTGRQAVPCVHAGATMTLALPKTSSSRRRRPDGCTWRTSRCRSCCTSRWPGGTGPVPSRPMWSLTSLRLINRVP